MKIVVDRKWKRPNYTISNLFIDGVKFCNVLEDPDRGLTDKMSLEEIKRIKIKGNTCIPSGEYEVTITYSPRFKKNLPLINNVKGFDGIRIHSGNTAKDTEGCLLLGINSQVGKVLNSRVTVANFITKVLAAINRKEKVIILIGL